MKFPSQASMFIGQDINCRQWQQQVARLRDVFIQQPQKTWLLFCQDSYQFSLYFFALIAANKRLVLPPSGQILQLQECMLHAEIFLGDIASNSDGDSLATEQPSFSCFDIQALQVTFTDEQANCATIDDALVFSPNSEVIFFTSGSSGQAKAINKTLEQLIIEVEQLEKTFSSQLQPTDNKPVVVMATVSHQHIYGLLFKLLWPLWVGRDLYLQSFAYPEHLVQKVNELNDRTVCLISSPAYYHRLLNDNVLVTVKDQLKVLFSSGGPLNPEAAISLKTSLNISPVEVFGSTETGGIAWRQRTNVSDDIWQVFSDIQCKAESISQKLVVLSPYVDKTNWYQTDDRIELVDKQRFKLLGRADRIVKIEEKRCSLDDITTKLLTHDWVDHAYVLVDEQIGKRRCLAAVVELSSIGKKAFANEKKFNFDRQLKSHLKQYFEAIVVPRKFRYLEEMPYNAQGKLNKKYLESLFV